MAYGIVGSGVGDACKCRDFSAEYVGISHDLELADLFAAYNVQPEYSGGVPTGAMVLVGDAEYIEVWVSYSGFAFYGWSIFERIA